MNSGNVYKVLMITNEMAKSNKLFVPTVVYDDKHGDLWSRPLSDFLEKFRAI